VEHQLPRKHLTTIGTDVQRGIKVGRLSQKSTVEMSQQKVYDFFLEGVRNLNPDKVLRDFCQLFIHLSNTIPSSVSKALTVILLSGRETEFQYTLQRCCYILVNNWNITGNYHYTQYLIDLFLDPVIKQSTKVPQLKILRSWILNFVNSNNYEALKLFVSRYGDGLASHWCDRFSAYLLTSQYADIQNSLEQRQLASALSQRIKNQFKFDLAMYTARSRPQTTGNDTLKNPTGLGDEVLYLIKIILTKQGAASYRNQANSLLERSKEGTLISFKLKLQEYLKFSSDDREIAELFASELGEKLNNFYAKHNDRKIDSVLIHKTCNQVISCLTLSTQGSPSQIFTAMLQFGNPLNFVILFLKIFLICDESLTHIETCIAELIKHYSHFTEDECRSLINFLDMLNVTFAIYAKDMEYNLVKMNKCGYRDSKFLNLEDYRIFSQSRH
jgi:hypothetical protein